MPHLSGFDILKLINDDSQLNEEYKNKVILITALAQNKETINLKEIPLGMWILWQKSCILGPTIFKTPQPN